MSEPRKHSMNNTVKYDHEIVRLLLNNIELKIDAMEDTDSWYELERLISALRGYSELVDSNLRAQSTLRLAPAEIIAGLLAGQR